MNTAIKVAVAGAMALAAANAMALTPAEIQTAAGNGTLVTLYVSGATATDNAFENLFKIDDQAFRVCQPSTLDIYYFKSGSGSISQRALTCTASFSATGITSGTTKLALLKESAGGSANGIINPATNTALPFIDLVNGASNFASACATVTGSGATLPAGSGTFNTRDCGHVLATATQSTVTRTNFVPQAGISDIDPASFVGTGGVTSAHDSALTRKRTSVAVTFNPIVSVPLFTALQRAYGYIGPNVTENTSSLAFVPSLPSSTLRAIFNGNSILNASEVSVNGVKLNTVLNGFDLGGDIYLCRRGDTSGTMTSFKLHFLGQGCNKNVASNVSFIGPDSAGCTTSGCAWNSTTYGNDFVFAGSGSGDVRSCMDYQSSQGRLAVGVASTEAKPGTSSNRYRYIKVDGAEPTLKAVMEGRYDFFTENTFNDKFPGTSASGSQSLWDKLFSSVGNSVAISELNRSWRSSVALTLSPDDGSADTGILDVASASNATAITNLFSDGQITGAEVRATPINSQTRQTLSGGANNCNQPYQAYP